MIKNYDLTTDGINHLIKDIKDEERYLKEKTDEIAKRLADIGAEHARVTFATAQYDGLKDNQVEVKPRGEGSYAVVAEGETVLFIEFGVGNIGYGHPEAAINGMGPGTYPGQTHVPDPGWWYLPGNVTAATGKKVSIGNPPAMAMYNAVKYLEQNIQQIAQEVLARD